MLDLEQTFKTNPPTPEEFLSERYLGNVADYLFPHIGEAFIETFKERKKHIVLIPELGWGRSMYVVLCNLYLSILSAYDESPQMPLDHTQVVLIPKKRFEELVVYNYIRVLEESPFFHEVDYDTYVDHLRKHLGHQEEPLAIYYTRESKKYQFRLSSGVDILITDNPNDMLGTNPISIDISEVSYYDEARKDAEYVLRLHSNCISRCNTRWHPASRLGMTFLGLDKNYHSELIKPYLFDLSANKTVKIIR